MTLHRLALPVLALALGTPSLLMAGNGVSPSTAIQDDDRRHDRGDWNAPPSEFRDVQRQGYRDGIDAGREDAEHTATTWKNQECIAIPRFARRPATNTVKASAAATIWPCLTSGVITTTTVTTIIRTRDEKEPGAPGLDFETWETTKPTNAPFRGSLIRSRPVAMEWVYDVRK